MKPRATALQREVGAVVLVVGRALQQYGKAAVTGGSIDVGFEGDAVAGLHGDVVLDHDLGIGLCQRRSNKNCDREHEDPKTFSGHEIPQWRKPRQF